jgi:hypothetical protein
MPSRFVGDVDRDGKRDIAILSRRRPNSTMAGSTHLMYGKKASVRRTTHTLTELLE